MTNADDKLVLTAGNLKVGWQGKTVAEIDSLSLHPGEIVVIAGPNGVGKSTTVKTLARQIKPISGNVLLSGADIWMCAPRAFAKSVAYVAQNTDPPRNMLVKDMVALGRNPHQIWWSWQVNSDDGTAIKSALDATETSHLTEKEIGTLSGGELQRVALAMALAQQSTFVLLDEPTSHLDYKHQLQLVELLKKLRSQQLGVLLVLHDLNLIGRLADRVVLLRKEPTGTSKIFSSGSPAEVLVNSNLRDVYEINVSVVEDTASGIKSYVPTGIASD
jgi:iron complex transport system ATP-binding protein